MTDGTIGKLLRITPQRWRQVKGGLKIFTAAETKADRVAKLNTREVISNLLRGDLAEGSVIPVKISNVKLDLEAFEYRGGRTNGA